MNSIRFLRPWYLKLQKFKFFCQIVFLRTLFIGLNLVGFIEPKVKKLWAATVRIDGFLLHMLGFFSRSFPLSFIFHFLSHFFPLRLHIFFLHLWEAPRPRGHSCHDEEIDAFVSFHALISHFKLSVGLKSMVLSSAYFLASWDPRYTRRAR